MSTIEAARPKPSIRFRGRSFLALVLAPVAPIDDWFVELDAWARRSPGFFVGRAVVLDVSGLELSRADLAGIIAELHSRDIRILGVEGTIPSMLGLGMPPLLNGGKKIETLEAVESGSRAPVMKAPGPQVPSLTLDRPVRSGQSVTFPQGDVTIIGSVASGAEVVAGGSIHVYGALRGRAIAGSAGNAAARIYSLKLEAELLAIDGLYRTADDMDPQLRGRAVQAWLNGDAMMMAALN